jgi:hypothetical protein
MSKGKYQRKKHRAQARARQVPELTVSEVKVTDNSSSNSSVSAIKGRNIKQHWWNIPTVTDWLLAAFTLALVATGVYQYLVLKGQLRLTRVALDVDQRPWIRVTYPNAQPVKDPQPAEIHFAPNQYMLEKTTFKNIGKSPARNLLVQVSIEIVPAQNQPVFDLTTALHSGIPIAFPDDPFVVTAIMGGINKPAVLSSNGYESINNGTAVLITFGRITYETTLGVSHEQRFCNWMDPAQPAFAENFLPTSNAKTHCAKYNYADATQPN